MDSLDWSIAGTDIIESLDFADAINDALASVEGATLTHDQDLEELLNTIAAEARQNDEVDAQPNDGTEVIDEQEKVIAELEVEIIPTIPLKIQCTTCDMVFNDDEFTSHVCDYDENKEIITDDEHVLTFEEKTMKLLMFNGTLMQSLLRGCKLPFLKERRKKGSFDCQLCDRKFVYESGLSRHMEKHRIEEQPKHETLAKTFCTIAKCMECGEVFSLPTYALEHLKQFHANIKLPSDGTSDSIKVIVASSIFQCEFCDCVFTKLGDLFHHSSLHCPSESFACSACDVRFDKRRNLLIHWQNDCVFMEFEDMRRIKLVKYFACNVCQEEFDSVRELNLHRASGLHFFPRINHQTGCLQVICGSCDGIFESAASLIAHYNSVHVIKPAQTKKPFAHVSKKPRLHLCDICGKSYTQSSHLHQHLRFHQGIKPFTCSEKGCGRKFTIRPDLNDHIRKCHTGERPYHCLLCGKRFLTGSVYYQHRLIHRGERRYGCDQCDKKFYRADALKNHLRIHSGEKPYQCPHCTKKFRQRGDREKHIRARHKFLPPQNVGNILPPDCERKQNRDVMIKKPAVAPTPKHVLVPVSKRAGAIKLPLIDPRKIQS